MIRASDSAKRNNQLFPLPEISLLIALYSMGGRGPGRTNIAKKDIFNWINKQDSIKIQDNEDSESNNRIYILIP